MRIRPLVLATMGLAAAAACSNDGTGSSESAVTYYRDVKPIVDAKCVGCHNANGIAPFSLDNPTDVIEHGDEMLDAIETGIMPPWPPNDSCNQYLGDRSLSADQKQTLRTWLDGGKAKGDSGKEGAPLDVERVQLTRVDREISMTAPYMPRTTAAKADDYRCFVIPWPETATRFVTGFRAIPGNPKIVHHVIAFLATPKLLPYYQDKDAAEDGPGYTCFGTAGGPDGGRNDQWVGAWAPGTLGTDTPDGTGLRIEPGSAIILQVHYNVVDANPQPDQTKLQFKLDGQVAQEADIQPWANPSWLGGDMLIPAGKADVMHDFQYDASLAPKEAGGPGGPFTVHAAALHMHQLGSRATASIVHPDGSSQCLLQIDDWNFHWQGSYGLRTPVAFKSGDQLRVECHWDNSPQNQPMVNGELRVPRDVNWGEGTSDEMCLGVFYITPNN